MQIFPRFERSKLVPRLLIGLAAALATTFGAYAFFVHSEPFEFGTHFVSNDPRVIAVTGASRHTDLRVLRGFRFSFGDRSGTAEMTLLSRTERGAFDVKLSLKKSAGRWSVERAYVYPPSGPAVTVVEANCTDPCS